MTDRRTFLCEDFEISYEDTKKGWSMPYSHHHTNYEIYKMCIRDRGDSLCVVSCLIEIDHQLQQGVMVDFLRLSVIERIDLQTLLM